MTLSCPGDVEKEGEVRAESIRFKSVVYKSEKAICGKLEGLKFIRSERGGHTKNYSDIELMGILSDYFKYNSYITRLELERVCGMTRSTAYRRIKSWMARNMLEKVVGIDAYRPVPEYLEFHVNPLIISGLTCCWCESTFMNYFTPQLSGLLRSWVLE